MKIQLIIIYVLSFVLINYGLDVEDVTLPSSPLWVIRSLSHQWLEKGFDVHEGAVAEGVQVLSRELDEEIARLHIAHLDANLATSVSKKRVLLDLSITGIRELISQTSLFNSACAIPKCIEVVQIKARNVKLKA
jgi:hypothetical protein